MSVICRERATSLALRPLAECDVVETLRVGVRSLGGTKPGMTADVTTASTVLSDNVILVVSRRRCSPNPARDMFPRFRLSSIEEQLTETDDS